ncbi:unnamed protein product [Adineta ricciae]|uniref:Translation initiation factor eIF2B subunit gamma n=3 Tax=Adineta ricciae TaxID=249248 RepID=A0A815K7A3_ADIRI|nr:unnamed protein product [Adineta ricciae]
MKEFTVVLYAGANRPLIWYTLQIIQSHPALASSPLLILTSGQYRQVLDSYLSTLNITYELVTYRQHHESTSGGEDQQQAPDELGTLDVLRSCYSRIRTESICLITCDLFGKVNLTPLVNMFRVRDASLCMLLLKATTSSTGKEPVAQPGQKMKFTPELEYYTVDQSTNTITSIQLKADLEQVFPLRQAILINHPRTTIRTDLVDAHIYLIKKSCLDIGNRSSFSSFRKEFLPKLIRQIVTDKPLEDLVDQANNQRTMMRQKTMDMDDHGDLSRILEQYDCDDKQVRGGCYYVTDETQLFRVKHVIAYLEANRHAAALISSYTNEDILFKDRIEQVQIGNDCIVGDAYEIGKKTKIIRTIIGKNCRIEDKCKIINCVLLDHVHVKEGVTLQNSILCSRSTIGAECELQNSIVCSNQQVDGKRKLNGETISAASNESVEYMLLDDEP